MGRFIIEALTCQPHLSPVFTNVLSQEGNQVPSSCSAGASQSLALSPGRLPAGWGVRGNSPVQGFLEGDFKDLAFIEFLMI